MDTRKIVFLLNFSAFSSAVLYCSNDLRQLCVVNDQKIIANEEFEIIRTTSIPITELILSSIEFSKFPTIIFVNYPNLTFLSVSSNSLKVVNFKHFANAMNLKRLIASNGNLVMITNGTFRSCARLEELQIYNHKISTVAVNAFQGLTNLIKLVLCKLVLLR